MNPHPLSLRLTHRYVGTFRHLDSWRYLGAAKVTPGRIVDPGNGYDEGRTYIRWATLPRGIDRDAACRALEDTMSRWGCAHEWDCCGCASHTTRVLHRHGRRVVLKTWVSYNY